VTRSSNTSDALAAKVGPRGAHPARRRREACAASQPRAADRELIDAIQAGDSTAAAPLYARLVPSIRYSIQAVLRSNPPEYEDLIQATFERVIRAVMAGRFEGRSHLKTWASTIAVHVAIDFLHKWNRDQQLLEPLDSEALPLWLATVRPSVSSRHVPSCTSSKECWDA
jgi:DNA-directed RNA polymerase specialized sigma24 family protein